MTTARGPKVKICGVTAPADAEAVSAAGADYMGVILTPGYRRSVEPERAAEIFRKGPRGRVGVFVDANPDAVAELAGALELAVVQLHGSESPDTAERIGRAGPWSVWKTFHARPDSDLEGAVRSFGDAIHGALVDTWDPRRPGGSGRTFPWDGVAASVRAGLGRRTFIAAGGLSAHNVGEAIRILSPDVVDVSSGVETTPARKDAAKVRSFVAAIREGAGERRP